MGTCGVGQVVGEPMGKSVFPPGESHVEYRTQWFTVSEQKTQI